jgi:dTDP-4-amino-4,6-dideoxygalactose transaminase
MQFNQTKHLATEFGDQLQEAFNDVIHSGVYLNGPWQKRFESDFSEFTQTPYVVSVASGHDALILALQSLNISTHDQVIVQNNSYPTLFPVLQIGAQPILVDCDRDGQIDISSLEESITDQTKAIIVTHLYGNTGNIEAIKKIAMTRNCPLIEDCAQSFGTKFQEQLTGTHGQIGCFSFYPTKNLGTLGDGGAIITRDKKIYEFLLAARAYGEKERYQSMFISGHSRLAELQAAALSVFLKKFEENTQKKQTVMGWFRQQLKELKLTKKFRLLESDSGSIPVPHLFAGVTEKRDALQAHLKKNGIDSFVHYPIPAHQVVAYSAKYQPDKKFPQSTYLAQHVLSLPFHAYLSHDDVESIVLALRSFYHG